MLVRLECLVSSLVIHQYFRCHHQCAFNLPPDELHDSIYFGAAKLLASILYSLFSPTKTILLEC